MEKEVEDYLFAQTNTLNGQLRGAINEKARDINKNLVLLVLGDVFRAGYELGKAVNESKETVAKLKETLGIKINENDSNGSES